MGAITLVGTASTNVIACGEAKSFKDNLSKIDNVGVTTRIRNKTYSQLDDFIFNTYFIYVPLKDGYEIKYYSDEAGQHEVTNDNQIPGIVYFTIKAANDDPNWEGITKKLSIIIFKNNIIFINKYSFPSDFKKQFENNKIYTDLNLYIISQCIYFKNVPLKDGYEIKYYSDEAGQHEVTNDNQIPGIVYFTIKLANDDPNWEGKMNKIKLELI